MLITLLKPHETPDRTYQVGETIDVSKETYDWLMEIYKRERGEKVLKELSAKKALQKWNLE